MADQQNTQPLWIRMHGVAHRIEEISNIRPADTVGPDGQVSLLVTVVAWCDRKGNTTTVNVRVPISPDDPTIPNWEPLLDEERFGVEKPDGGDHQRFVPPPQR